MRLPYSQTQMRHFNPGAKEPLILPIQMVCVATDEQLASNVRENSKLEGVNWVKEVPEHGLTAVLCGSGPSLGDFLTEIKYRILNGCKIFAMNGAAGYLYDHGIMPDYQVIVDPQEATAQLIGPARAHLFASQVHPECFRKMPSATLWHLAMEGIDDWLPDDSGDLTLIGGSSSVGNCATCLAYAMGYRNLQIYGYDSSHRGNNSHAFHQKMNDGDPCCIVDFGGKEYTCSLTMKSQAERFQETAHDLKQVGCSIEVHGDGLLPALFNAGHEIIGEQEKYTRMWKLDAYREISPGLSSVPLFIELVKPVGTVYDFGCGTGVAAIEIAKTNPVLCLDIADNCSNKEARHLPFLRCDFRLPIPAARVGYGFCTDLMEHIPSEEVDVAIINIFAVAETVFFQISTLPDNHGTLIGQYLHLTVRPLKWWRKKFEDLGFKVTWELDTGSAALFIVSASPKHLQY